MNKLKIAVSQIKHMKNLPSLEALIILIKYLLTSLSMPINLPIRCSPPPTS